ncbi:Rap family tetratricopeptide repeat protein [Bacillus cereus group sp. BfR-BA-01380]|uniref:Rap family tetratricopeptide repeat protein n=1 Tax=Bacillus cereus group sp. BfR-BA-01380 TaxID=2920324 RepID=UPI001F58D2BA|nr:Rap family tetratricopeptide repeat protein [Bacillus cereus group sp. BfR-BA-01380]
MKVSVKGNEQITKLLNDWYQAMLRQQNIQATNLKREIEDKLSGIKEDENLLLYYSLLDFRYKVLTNGLNITKDSFNKINSFDIPDNSFLTYYYHFFQAIHNTILANYNEAKEQFEQAEKLLMYIPDQFEKAEFHYRFASFYYQTYQPLPSISHANKAKDFFSKTNGYDINIALCENVLGLTCIQIRQFEQAEEYLNKAIDIVKKIDNTELLLRIRNNLGWLYASQGLSTLAIRHLSEVTEHLPDHYKAIFLQAREHYKLGEHNAANLLIEKGIAACTKVENKEYMHRFNILKKMNNNCNSLTLENVVMAGLSYFEVESLTRCVQEYTEILATVFYAEENHIKASKYFYMSNEARKKYEEKGALV